MGHKEESRAWEPLGLSLCVCVCACVSEHKEDLVEVQGKI